MDVDDLSDAMGGAYSSNAQASGSGERQLDRKLWKFQREQRERDSPPAPPFDAMQSSLFSIVLAVSSL